MCVRYVKVVGYGKYEVGVRGQREELLVTCADGVVGRAIMDVGGEVWVVKGVDVVDRGYEGECVDDYVEVGYI